MQSFLVKFICKLLNFNFVRKKNKFLILKGPFYQIRFAWKWVVQ
jgi:hypothetical protein